MHISPFSPPVDLKVEAKWKEQQLKRLGFLADERLYKRKYFRVSVLGLKLFI